jgi:DNA-binding ferritin-like protein
MTIYRLFSDIFILACLAAEKQCSSFYIEVYRFFQCLPVRRCANMKETLALATIKELADKPISSEDTVKGLIADVEYWIKDSREIVELAEAAGDGVTADQFNDYLGEYQKLLWMLKSYIA